MAISEFKIDEKFDDDINTSLKTSKLIPVCSFWGANRCSGKLKGNLEKLYTRKLCNDCL